MSARRCCMLLLSSLIGAMLWIAPVLAGAGGGDGSGASSAPEPASLALLAVGIGGIVVLRGRRKK